MASRLELHSKLVELLGTSNVYYQPPETINMEYPAIVYSKSNIRSVYADDKTYLNHKNYEIVVIDKRPDNPVIDKLLALPMCSYSRQYKADNLNHDALTLYF